MTIEEIEDALLSISTMPLEMATVHKLQELFHRDCRIVKAPLGIKLLAEPDGLGTFIVNLTSEQKAAMDRFGNSLHEWKPDRDSPYKEICRICKQKRHNPEKESAYHKRKHLDKFS